MPRWHLRWHICEASPRAFRNQSHLAQHVILYLVSLSLCASDQNLLCPAEPHVAAPFPSPSVATHPGGAHALSSLQQMPPALRASGCGGGDAAGAEPWVNILRLHTTCWATLAKYSFPPCFSPLTTVNLITGKYGATLGATYCLFLNLCFTVQNCISVWYKLYPVWSKYCRSFFIWAPQTLS